MQPSTTRWSVCGRFFVLIAAFVAAQQFTVRTALADCDAPANKIVAENCQTTGVTPQSGWDVTTPPAGEVIRAGDLALQGFSTDISVNHGQTISFKITTTAAAYHIDIYRIGWYGGNGARLIDTIPNSATLKQSQPTCLSVDTSTANATTALVDCGNWSVSASWPVPSAAVTGLYIARLVREDGSGNTIGASHIPFIVRDDEHPSDVLFKTSDTTWQAYNNYSGWSLYVGKFGDHAVKVSYNRPIHDLSETNSPFNAEFPLIRFLERNGYDVSYFSSVDADRSPSLLQGHKIVLSTGHDEYWSAAERAAFEAARDSGTSLAFFGGNDSFQKVRWENSIDGSNTPYRTLVDYKEGMFKIDPATNIWTGTWRDPRWSPPADGGRPENALIGTLYMVNVEQGTSTTTMEVPYADSRMRFWRNTTIHNTPPGGVATLPFGTLGYEFNEDLDNGFRPGGLIQLSTTTRSGVPVLQDYGFTYADGTATHHMTMYRKGSAIVFSAGSIQFSWGLDSTHDHSTALTPSDPNAQQAIMNLLADMHVNAATIQCEAGVNPCPLVPAAASQDATPPSSAITAPAPNISVAAGTAVTVTGMASDTAPGLVGGVEVSTDCHPSVDTTCANATWHPAAGRETWTYTFTQAQGTGTTTILSRATDDSLNMQPITSSQTNAVVINNTFASCPCTLWPATVNTGAQSDDSTPVNVAVKFQSDISGYITALRFYKHPLNIGPHIGYLWNAATQQVLASATFNDETATGWQQVTLNPAVPITANTLYIAAYFAPYGHWPLNRLYFSTQYDLAPLHAPAGDNGVFIYDVPGTFPTSTFQSSNYFVDVVFETTHTADSDPPTVMSTTPANGTTGVDANTNITVKFSEAMDPATITSATVQLLAAGSSPVQANVTYDASTISATINPVAVLTLGSTYTVVVKGGASGVKDVVDNALGSDVTATFTTSPTPLSYGCPCTLWTAATGDGGTESTNGSAVNLGLKFQSDAAGYIKGVRFFKQPGNNGVNTAMLWTLNGTLLASKPFPTPTGNGWQEVRFDSPIPIDNHTTYIVAYHTAVGHWAETRPYFATAPYVSGPLRALQRGYNNGNSVFANGPAGTFPNTDPGDAPNYWVDPIFDTVAGDSVVPVIASANATTFTVGLPGTFTVATTGASQVTITESGALPAGITFTDSHDGTGALSGTAQAGSGGVYPISFTASDAAGSSPAQSFTLTINEAPFVRTQPANATVCDGSMANYTADAGGYPQPSVQWQISTDGTNYTNIAGATSGQYTTPAVTAANSGAQYRAVFTNTLGAAQTSAATLTVSTVPPPAITPGSATVCASSNGNTASGPSASTYSWSIVNGTITGGQNAQTVTYTAGASGTVDLTLAVTNALGCVATNTAHIATTALPAPPTISVVSGSTTFCQGSSVTLGAPSATTYRWLLNGVAISGATNQNFTATAAGDYTVQVTNDAGCASTSAPTTVIVNAVPTAPTAQNNGPYCEGQTIQLTTPTVAGATYTWTDPVGFMTNEQNPSIANATTSMSGTYSVTVTINGCTSPAGTTTVVVNPKPLQPAITNSGSVTFCQGGSVTLTSSSTSGNQWFLNGAPIDNAIGTTYSATTSGDYTVQVTSSSGCASAKSAATTVTVNPLPTAPAVTLAPNACTGSPVALTATAASGTLTADFGDGSAQAPLTSGTPVNHTYATAGTFNVVVTATSTSGCTSTTTKSITINATPSQPAITPSGSAAFCAGGSVLLTSTSASGNQWYLDGAPIVNATGQTYSATSGGTYTVVVTTNGCSSAASAPTTVTVNDNPAAPSITAPASVNAGSGGNTASGPAGASSYAWTIDNGSISGAANAQSITFTSGPTGSVTLHLTITNASGCSASNSVTIPINTNRAPVAANDSYATETGATLTVALPGVLSNDSDADGDALTAVLVSGASHGTLWLDPNGSFSYTPNSGFSGTDSFTYSANDGKVLSNAATVTIRVDYKIVSQDVPPGATLTSDTEGNGATAADPLEAAVTLPAGVTGTVTIAPTAQTTDVPPSGFSFINYAIDITAPAGTATSPLTIVFLLDRSILPDPVHDNEQTVQVFRDGLAVPDCGTAGFSATNDPCVSGRAAVGTDVQLTVTTSHASHWNFGRHNTNAAPVATGDSYSICQGAPLNVAAPGVLTNDSDADLTTLTAVVVAAPTQAASFTLNADGSFNYVPNPSYSGSDTFTYKAFDGIAYSGVVTVTITVNATPATPAAHNGGPYCDGLTISLTTDAVAGATYTWTGPNGFLSHDQNPTVGTAGSSTQGTYSLTVSVNGCTSPAGSTTVTVNPLPATPTITAASAVCASSTGNTASTTATGTLLWSIANGTIVGPNNGSSIIYTAAATGPVHLTLSVSNGSCSSSAAADVTVNPVPATPTVTAGGALTFCQGGSVTLSSSSTTGNQWYLNGGSISGATGPQYSATATGTYTVVVTLNGCASAASAGKSVTVNPAPTTPAITATPSTVAPNSTGNTASGPASATSYAWSITNGTITSVTNAQNITYSAGAFESVTLTLTVTNSSNCPATNSLTVPINNNQPPTANNDSYETFTNTPLNRTAAQGVLANDTDPEHDAFTAVLTAGPSHGSLVLNGDGSFNYTPAADFNGADTFKYKAKDVGTITSTDDVLTDFQAGNIDGCTATTLGNGDVMLTPSGGSVETFSGTTVPMGWAFTSGASVSNGSLVLENGSSRLGTGYNQRNAEFVATFTATKQQIGFSTGTVGTVFTTGERWAMFTTDGTGSTLFVKTNDGSGEVSDTLTGSYVGGPHKFRIEWTSGQMLFYIDGAPVGTTHTFNFAPPSNNQVRFAASDANADNSSLSLDWVRIGTFTSPCTFTSRIHDANGSTWKSLNALLNVPANTSITFQVLTGNTPAPDGTWTTTNNYTLGATLPAGRYLQYKATLTGSGNSPSLEQVVLSGDPPLGNEATVTINVKSPNAPPVANNDSYNTCQGTPLTVAATGVLGNDTDADGNPITAALASGPSHGSLALSANGSFTYTPAAGYSGLDSFTYNANDGTTNSTSPATVTITINAQPTVSITGPTSACANSPATLTANATGGTGPYTYSWSTGATGMSINPATSTPGATTYTVTVTDAKGCISATASVNFTVNANPTVSITGPASACANSSATLTANPLGGTGPYTYAWSNGGNGPSISPSTTTPGTTTYSVTVTDANGCISANASVNFSVTANPTVTISGPASSCPGGPATLTANVSGGAGPYTYAWSTTATSASINPSTATPGTTTYTVTVTDANGCSSGASASFTVNTPPAQPTISASGPLAFCQGGSVTLTASDATSYQWSTGEISKSITVSAAGNYTVTITDANGCHATSDATVVTVNSPTTPTITVGGSTSFCQGGSATLTASDGTAYLWSTGETTKSIVVASGGKYTVQVTNSSGCASTSAATNITVKPLLFANTGTWTAKASSPTARRWAASSALYGILYAAGGAPPSSTSSINTFEAYNPATNTWSAKAPLPVATQQAGAVAINGLMYVVGGGTCCSALNTLQVYDPIANTWTTKAPMPHARYHVVVAALDGILYAVGGGDGHGIDYPGLVEAYDPSTDTWSTKASIPGSPNNVALAAANGLLYAIGGHVSSVPQVTVQAYNPSTNSWSARASMPTARFDALATVLNGIVYVFGGNTGSSILTTVEAYNPTTDAWTTMSSMPAAYSAGELDTDAIGSVIYVLGGTDSSVLTNQTFAPGTAPIIAASGPTAFCAPGSVTLTAPAGYTYLWSNSSTAQQITVTASGNYGVVVTDGNGCSATSGVTTVTVKAAPAITAQPSNASVILGSAATFTAAATDYTSVQWQASTDGQTFTDIGGAVSPTLTFTPALTDSGKSYHAVFTNSDGCPSATTTAATLTVTQAPSITSANNTTFTVGTNGSFTVTATGSPAPAITESGALPNGVAFNAGVLNGTPTVSGSYPITFTATNSAGTQTQSFTLTVNQAPSFTSLNSLTTTVGTAINFAITASGFPAPAITESGTLPAGVTFSGTALTGTPTANGVYNITFTAANGVGIDATQNFTLTVNQPASFTSANTLTATAGTAINFAITATGFPAPTITESGALPTGVTFTGSVLTGTPTSNGVYSINFTAHNGIGIDATQSFTLTVNQPPSFTSANNATFTAGTGNSFNVTASGYPAPTFTEGGALPSGVTLSSNGVLSGTPAAGTGGTYSITITAHNGIGSDATQLFTLTVNQAPSITSANNATFTFGVNGSFTVTASGFPAPTITETGALPNGVTFNGGVLSGTPTQAGSYPITFTATNNVGTSPQSFTLTVNQAPSFTSANNATFTFGVNGSFTVTATGFPAPSIGETGTLPNGVTFNAGVLSGTPTQAGSYPITFTATNSAGTQTQNFTLTVNQAPSFSSANNATFTFGVNGSFTVTATGFPTPSISATGTLPNGVTFSAGVLSGTPTQAGSYPITFTATNSAGTAPQSFTLNVNQPPSITSANNATFTFGVNGSFTVTATGFPAPTISKTGTLPSGVTLTAGVLSGTPTQAGGYPITLTATNAAGADTQTFTLTVNQAPSITSANTLTTSVGTALNFPITATGFPVPAISESGALPAGVTFTGTALTGTPAANGVYNITFTAQNGIGLDATQNFTLTINQTPSITSANSATFTAGVSNSFTVTATGFPAPTLSATALPAGVSFVNNGNGTGTLSGNPTTGGSYPITFTATNTAGTGTQSFTLTVNQAPSFTSPNILTTTAGTAINFAVTASGFPTATIVETGALPAGVTFTGTALTGTPTSNGVYNIIFTAHNGIGVDATQNFTLTVNQAAVFTSASSLTTTAGTAVNFPITAAGFPAPAITESGALPAGVSFSGTALTGTPTANGVYSIVFTAHNGIGVDATQNFTLTVNQAPAITSANNAAFTADTSGTFTVTATGYPAPTFSETGALPSGVSLSSNGVLSGTPAAGTGGTYAITITAHNGIGSDATQSFTLTVNQTPVITSAAAATFAIGSAGTFTVTASGYPAPTLTESGALPTGVTFNATTGVLSGIPAAGTAGTYTLTFTATNAAGSSQPQTFTLTVNAPPAISIDSQSVNNPPRNTTTTMTFHLTLSGTATGPVTVTCTTQNQTAFAGTDFVGKIETVTVSPTTGGTFTVTILSANGSGTKQFAVNLSNPSGATVAIVNGSPSRGIGLIVH